MPAAADLCTRCGLCCAGVFFTYVVLLPEETAWAERRRLPLVRKGGETAFDQPCQVLADRKCSDYAQRPVACQRFRCKLLRAFEAGQVEMPAALEVIARVEALVAKAGPGRHEVDPKDASVERLLDIGELEAVVTRHFRDAERVPNGSMEQ